MLIDEEDDYQRLIAFYRQFNSSQSSPACGLELKASQNVAHTSQTCMRRNDISHSLIDLQEIFCDPIDGLNIYSKLLQSWKTIPQMFLKSNESTGDAHQPATALITFLALAHLIGEQQDVLRKQDKEILFVTLDGDALDYSASFKFICLI